MLQVPESWSKYTTHNAMKKPVQLKMKWLKHRAPSKATPVTLPHPHRRGGGGVELEFEFPYCIPNLGRIQAGIQNNELS